MPIRAVLFRDRLQRRIELHEGVLHGGVAIVALPAWVLRTRHCRGSLGVAAETEIGPAVGEARFVLHLNGQALQIALKVAGLIDRALVL
jgi:hypothetical protein